jgi:hypothetical protein
MALSKVRAQKPGESLMQNEMMAVPKYLLTRVGETLSRKTIFSLNAAVNYLELGRWMRAHGYKARHRVERRERLFDLVGAEVAERNVLYMEFGVWQGRTTRYWSKLLRNPKSKLHGFDSFEGLPENWHCVGRGGFSVGGKVPEIDDPRVQFFKGWFEQTLPRYEIPAHEVLVLNFDADLYSSTKLALNTVRDAIVPGTYLYFDDFNQPLHEVRAFDEFIEQTKMKFELLGATYALGNVLFQSLG